MGSKGSKSKSAADNEPSGSEPSGSEPSKPSKTIYEKIMMKSGPKPEEILITELVNIIPKHLSTVNDDKRQFMQFYQDIWLPERVCLMDKLKELYDESVSYRSMTELTEKMLYVSAASKALMLLFVIFFVQTILSTMILTSLVVDGVVVYLYNERKLKKDKIQTLVPIFHRDISNTVMLKMRWSNARRSFRVMQGEVSRFIFDVKNLGYENDDPVVQRFLNNVKVRNSEDSKELGLFFLKDFIELICDYNASLKFFKIQKNDAYHEYYKRCHEIQTAIVEFGGDITLYFKDMDFTDITQSAMEIISGDLNALDKKIKSTLDILTVETESSNSSTERAKANLKKRA